MMRVLLVWEEVPETTRCFYLEDAPDWLLSLHNHYINNDAEGDVLERLNVVSDALCRTRVHCSNPEHALAGTWADKVLDGPRHSIHVDAVVVCGFVL